ncbi:Bromodomain and WD repeat-containing protein 1 [Linum perenne]
MAEGLPKMALQKYIPLVNTPSNSMKPLSFPSKVYEDAQLSDTVAQCTMEQDVDIDLREVYFLIMHFLSAGPCHRTYGQLWGELLENQLLPRRYHAWYSRTGAHSRNENDDGLSFPLSYGDLAERYKHIEKNHLVNLLKQLLLNTASPSEGLFGGNTPNAATVPTLLGTGSFSLLSHERDKGNAQPKCPAYMRWPHMLADQVRGLSLREVGGGFTRHHRPPSIRAASYAIAKPSTMVQKMQNIKRLRGHRNAVYCAIFDRLGRYVITGSDDRLVKVWSMETAFCLASCRGHEGDITDLAVSSNNALVASSSNDCVIRVWRLPDGLPISVLRGHTGAVTAIAFSPRPGSVYQLLSSSDDGTCRIWDARSSNFSPRVYAPKPPDSTAGKNNVPSSSTSPTVHQIFCCAFNASGTVFVTGSSDNLARVWNACKPNTEDSDQPNHEMDVLAGHENDVNYVQFRFSQNDCSKEENIPKFRNSWFSQDYIVTCSRDGSAIIWIPRSRRSHGKVGRWTRAYHLKVPPPPMPPQPARGGPRQRMLPTPRGVNMIVWSLDNRFVLAAIMDCRICVWNASDGSLVHSLTGHTDSTYVLDVHPFNPRIAMSAGYDGKTIVWDIWEGKPIRTYEISHFKLVDGKFSPDGTSIILSDDVGQLYILNTGQGESQKDAKYDQFFLGDYRPLIQDTYGNVVDQETQLVPYRRNMQDLLCDSGMIPYEEPYQSMYQKRRLGSMGLEWKPPSVKFAIGPDFSLDPVYHIFPLADLDLPIEPLPEFIDVMDWEPEQQMHSDDTDSEYNVPEEDSTGGEQGSFNSISSGDSDCSAEDSMDEGKDDFRRSKKKKHRAAIGVITASGRRIKRRNLDDSDGNTLRHNRARKSQVVRKTSKRKSSKSKALLRPQRARRAAAQVARDLFTRIKGKAVDGEDEDGSTGDASENESTEESDIESDESDLSSRSERVRYLKGKAIAESEERSHKIQEDHATTGFRKKLVLKLPVRNSSKILMPENVAADLAGSTSNALEEALEVNGSHVSSLVPGYYSDDANCETLEAGTTNFHHSGQIEKHNEDIRWGGVKLRSSKRQRLGEPVSLPTHTKCILRFRNFKEKDPVINGHLNPLEVDNNMPHALQVEDLDDKTVEVTRVDGRNTGFDDAEVVNDGRNAGFDVSEVVNGNTDELPMSSPLGNDSQQEQKDSLPVPTKLRIKLKPLSVGNHENGGGLTETKQNPDREEIDGRTSPEYGAAAVQKSSDHVNEISGPALDDSTGTDSRPKKMYTAVYRRSKSVRDRANSECESGSREGTSNPSEDLGGRTEVTNGLRRTRSMGTKLLKEDPNISQSNLNTGHKHDAYRDSQNGSIDRSQIATQEWGSSSRGTVKVRSTRNRRTNYNFHEPVHQPTKPVSWLLLPKHEEGSRYIPQLGDEVAYIRQGHQEYLDNVQWKEFGPWKYLKGGYVRAVEFCRVEVLDYATLPGSGDSCCKMTLKFVDPTSDVYEKSFKLKLPELTSFPDFIVERSRYEAALQRNWTCRDKCMVWWNENEESEEPGKWWDGRVLAVKPKSPEFPDSPWERYMIRYRDDPEGNHLHSPWELFDKDTEWEQPRIDDDTNAGLLSALEKLEQSANKSKDSYGVQKLTQVVHKSNFINRFPVPISLGLIKSRLENSYYRSLEAFRHDIQVMLLNAESYFGKNPEYSGKMKRLSEWFRRTIGL